MVFLSTKKRELGGEKGNKVSSVGGMRPQMWFQQHFLTIMMVDQAVEGEHGIFHPSVYYF